MHYIRCNLLFEFETLIQMENSFGGRITNIMLIHFWHGQVKTSSCRSRYLAIGLNGSALSTYHLPGLRTILFTWAFLDMKTCKERALTTRRKDKQLAPTHVSQCFIYLITMWQSVSTLVTVPQACILFLNLVLLRSGELLNLLPSWTAWTKRFD